jgi:membrane-associated phospholipid phosphatase
MGIWEWIINVDKELFTLIHVEGAVTFLDGFMKLLRHQYTWIPLYAFLLYFIIRFGKKQAIPFIVLTVLCFAITDYSSASIFKPMLGRLRPCHDPELMDEIRGLVGCGGPYSFPSSHASNHFGLATFWFLSIHHMVSKKWYWLWFWAFIICYAQIYVGKHYPLDIAGGALLGVVSGFLCYRLFDRWTSNTSGKVKGSRKPTLARATHASHQ